MWWGHWADDFRSSFQHVLDFSREAEGMALRNDRHWLNTVYFAAKLDLTLGSVCEGVPFTAFGGSTFLSPLLIDSWHLSELTFINSYFGQPLSNMFYSSPCLFGSFVTTNLLSESEKRHLRVYNDVYNVTPLLSASELFHWGFESLFWKQRGRKVFLMALSQPKWDTQLTVFKSKWVNGNEYLEESTYLDFYKHCGQVPATCNWFGIVFTDRQAWNQLPKESRSLFPPRFEQSGGGAGMVSS